MRMIVSVLHLLRLSVSFSRPKTTSSGGLTDFYKQNKKLSLLIRTGKLSDARSMFDKMPEGNTVTWNSMMTAYVKRREMAKARELFDEMPERDIVSWNLMISGYTSCRKISFLDEGRRLFDRMPQKDLVSWNTMISGFGKNGRMDEALELFNIMPQKNVVSWNALVTGFLQNGDLVNATKYFKRMPRRDAASLSALVSGLIQNGQLDKAARVLLEFGDDSDDDDDDDDDGELIRAYNTLIAGYGRNGRVEDARRLFDRIPYDDERKRIHGKFRRNVVSWNSMLMGYVKARDIVSARRLFDEMTERDIFCWNTMISGYIHMSDVGEAWNLFYEMPNPDTLSWNSMISGFAQIGNTDLAREFFENMPEKSLISWNSIIAAYERNQEYKRAIELFIQMQDAGLKPDRHTFSSIISASAGLIDLQLGTQFHQLLSKMVVPDTPLNNSLITMYSRCGSITEARAIFNEMNFSENVISWNAMIGGYASHGFAPEALELFELMKKCKVQPSRITFVSVLSACAHAGLVEEGRKHFKSMISEYGIKPGVEHYASLVDVVGRTGELEEAMDLIKSMPFEPEKMVWGALLGACRIHNNVELARLAAEVLARLEPDSAAPYILLYNMYADVGQWDDAAEVREMMERKKIKKQTASSWIDSSHC